jgi:hypothetical protein
MSVDHDVFEKEFAIESLKSERNRAIQIYQVT